MFWRGLLHVQIIESSHPDAWDYGVPLGLNLHIYTDNTDGKLAHTLKDEIFFCKYIYDRKFLKLIMNIIDKQIN